MFKANAHRNSCICSAEDTTKIKGSRAHARAEMQKYVWSKMRQCRNVNTMSSTIYVQSPCAPQLMHMLCCRHKKSKALAHMREAEMQGYVWSKVRTVWEPPSLIKHWLALPNPWSQLQEIWAPATTWRNKRAPPTLTERITSFYF